MINIARLHEQFKYTVNRLNSNFNKTFAVSVVDAYLNRSQDTIVERLMRYAEKDTKMRNHLRVLEKKEVPLEIIERTKQFVVGKYPSDFYRLLRQNAMVSTTDCNETRRILIHPLQSDDLSEALKDPYWEPSFEWEETVGDESAKGYHVYVKPDWGVRSIIVDYMRKPGFMAAYTLAKCSPDRPYITSNGDVVKQDMHCEFSDTYLWRYIADLAALFALRDLGQVDDAKSKMEEMIFSEIMQI